MTWLQSVLRRWLLGPNLEVLRDFAHQQEIARKGQIERAISDVAPQIVAYASAKTRRDQQRGG